MSSDTRHRLPSMSSNSVRVSNVSLSFGRPEIGLAGDQVDRVPRRGASLRPVSMRSLENRQMRLHLRRVGVLLPQGHPGAGGILEDDEPSLARDLILGCDDLSAGLLDLLLVLLDGVHGDVVDDARRPVSGLQATDAATGTAPCLEQRVVHAGHLLEFPSEETRIELLDLLRFLDMELDVHDASGFRRFGHDDSSVAASKRAGLYNRVCGRTRNVRRFHDDQWTDPRPDYGALGRNLRDAELMQYRSRVGSGPSSNTCPRCEPQFAHSTSGRRMNRLRSSLFPTLPFWAGAQKLGQPVPESSLVFEAKSSCPQTTHTYTPGSWLSQYSPV